MIRPFYGKLNYEPTYTDTSEMHDYMLQEEKELENMIQESVLKDIYKQTERDIMTSKTNNQTKELSRKYSDFAELCVECSLSDKAIKTLISTIKVSEPDFNADEFVSEINRLRAYENKN